MMHVPIFKCHMPHQTGPINLKHPCRTDGGEYNPSPNPSSHLKWPLSLSPMYIDLHTHYMLAFVQKPFAYREGQT